MKTIGSLGNNFILGDAPFESKDVQALCAEHHVDGVLVLHKETILRITLINADGSDGEFCGNGIRAVAAYWSEQTGQTQFKIKMGPHTVPCELLSGGTVKTTLTGLNYLGPRELCVDGQTLQAHRANVGNPHAVILKAIKPDWLKEHGLACEHAWGEAQRTNVEFVWRTAHNHYQILVHERGVGITQACGSGAMAVMRVLYALGEITSGDDITLSMPGGDVQSVLLSDNTVQQLALGHLY